jgi:hypothetical protein
MPDWLSFIPTKPGLSGRQKDSLRFKAASRRSGSKPGPKRLTSGMLISCRRIGGKSAGQWLRIEAATPAHSLESAASCYCDSDKLMNFAWQQFGQITHGHPRVQAICDWGHHNIGYRFLSGRADLRACLKTLAPTPGEVTRPTRSGNKPWFCRPGALTGRVFKQALSVSEVIERHLWQSNGAAKSTGTTHGVNTP